MYKRQDNLKLRVSYGSVGNARVNSYWRQDYKMESSANRQYYLNETVQSALKLQNTLRNENLTWETKLSSNVGIDASLFNSRLNVTVDFYNDITKDLILSLIHISEPTRLGMISYAVFCLKKKKKNK